MLNTTKFGLTGLAMLSVSTALVSTAVGPTSLAAAQASAPWVTDLCPKATWAKDFRIGEMIPLAVSQYRPAIVTTATALRSSYGFDGPVITNLKAGTRVTIVGEVWDIGCNQWMVVSGDGKPSFVHGNALRNL
jgi:hypothetical protein